jgi:hypothetical protein
LSAVQLELIEHVEGGEKMLLLQAIRNDMKGKKRNGQDGRHRDQHAGVQ